MALFGTNSDVFGAFTYEFLARKLLFRDYGFLNNLKYFCYIYFGFSSVYLIRESSQGLLTIFVMFLAIWATDVFAYYGGKRFGKRQLSTISPNMKQLKEHLVALVLP